MSVYEEMWKVFESVNKTFPSAFVDTTKKSGLRCYTEDQQIDFWVGLERKPSNGNWFSPFDQLADFSNINLQVAFDNENCVYNYAGQPKTTTCSRIFPCGICRVSHDKILYLKGLCEPDSKFYDLRYYIYGVKNNRPYFRQAYFYIWKYLFVHIICIW